ncbi:exodeoxyribonuclease III [Plasmodium gonderi]|uniref:Exodeoxyribonuclease III n=1 Tax=Plasmodium gonderi TaxID=77519 RepID=A0A1Y1JK99_PLAGO|nr:exodeoxyribonuclease III [Plasmodium gonderi]GAW82929.1 exodeoxyribonuclease III [Plasmodium gonderi]
MENLQIASWNVNGWKKSCELIKSKEITVAEFLRKLSIDILCLQETKTNDAFIENEFTLLDAYSDKYESYWTCCQKRNGEKLHRGYSGLATYVGNKAKIICCSSEPFRNFFFHMNNISESNRLIQRDFPLNNSSICFYFVNEEDVMISEKMKESSGEGSNSTSKEKWSEKFLGVKKISPQCVGEFFNEGRMLVTIHKKFVLINIYAPYSGCNYNRLDYKMRFLHAVRCKMIQLRITTGLPIILVGDMNISYRNRDVHYVNNIINLDELQKYMNKVSINEELKKNICKKLPLIIDTLQKKDNFIIKKRKTKNSESFHFYLNFNGDIKKVGTNFSSEEEIFFFFSLDPMYVQDKYAETYPNDFFFFLNCSGEKTENSEKNNHYQKNIILFSKPQCSNIPNSYISNTECDYAHDATHSNECKKDITRNILNENNSHSIPDHNCNNSAMKKMFELFTKENEQICKHFWNNENSEIEKYLEKEENNITYNSKMKNKIQESKKILCKYTFKSCVKGKYKVKDANCLYLKHLNDIFTALNINLSKEDLFNIANTLGYSSSPQCCTNFLKNLIYEDQMIDTFSYLYSSLNGKFTCWDMYKQYRITNEGSRIDYIFIDFILYERFIKDHSQLYKSPILITDELQHWLQRDSETKEHKHDIKPVDISTNYDLINSFGNNCKYANYFSMLKKQNKTDRNGNSNRSTIDDETIYRNEEEIYNFQFMLRSYIGFIYTSPRLSDHIAVNCTFHIKNELNGNNNKKRDISICCSGDAASIIPLRTLCKSSDLYDACLPLYLVSTSLFSRLSFDFLNPVHAHGGICQSVARAQPHKRTRKITQYFTTKSRSMDHVKQGRG